MCEKLLVDHTLYNLGWKGVSHNAVFMHSREIDEINGDTYGVDLLK